MNTVNLNLYVESRPVEDGTLTAAVAGQGLACRENPFSSAFVSLEATQPEDFYPNYMKGNGRN